VVQRPEHLHYVLANSLDPFSPASSEKKAALAHFEPRFVLISEGADRTVRGALQEQVLDAHSPVHRLAASFVPIVQEEADQLLRGVRAGSPAGSIELGWDRFIQSWYRVVRRSVFGDQARDDHGLTDMLARLRENANWSFLRPKDNGLRTKFLCRVADRLKNAGPGSLAFSLAKMRPGQEAAPVDQMPQWLFAFESAGMAMFRTLAVLARRRHACPLRRPDLRLTSIGTAHTSPRHTPSRRNAGWAATTTRTGLWFPSVKARWSARGASWC
jgi:hypothetical protein